MFQLKAPFKPTGDQPKAISQLVSGVRNDLKNQVLLGVTGSGKTFTMANIIESVQMPALIISHNKTLAGQLYQEMRDFFPQNAVSYFVSYYDYYQPEAYIPASGTYIEKEAQINELIDKLRLQATTNILTRKDTICVASVSCIYNIGSPIEYGKFILEIHLNKATDLSHISFRLAELQYERSEFEFKRGSFRIRGNYIDIYPAYEDNGYRVILEKEQVKSIVKFDPLTGVHLDKNFQLNSLIVYPAKHYMTDPNVFLSVESQIRKDLSLEYEELKRLGKLVEADRLLKRVNYDLEMIKEVGYVNGIENYSRYFDGRRSGDPPYSLIDYYTKMYGDNWLLFIDESHMTVPQLRGMFNGDYSRKKTLIEFGFRLKASYDNRPLKFEEFYPKASHIIYFSATPNDWEIDMSKIKGKFIPQDQNTFSHTRYNGIAEQLIRPTGIIDPTIEIRPSKNEVVDLVLEIEKRTQLHQKILVTTLTKKTAEDLSDYLKEKNIRAAYLHSDVKTLERSDILDNLRKNEFDVLIGVNLLREGLDLPEVYLVAILDADREGFLRSKTSLIQTMGRAARNISGEVIMYADTYTDSMKSAIHEINRRREYQIAYNKKFNITPHNIYKPLREKIIQTDEVSKFIVGKTINDIDDRYLAKITPDSLTPFDRKKLIKKLEKSMKLSAQDLNFELAIKIRDKIQDLKK